MAAQGLIIMAILLPHALRDEVTLILMEYVIMTMFVQIYVEPQSIMVV